MHELSLAQALVEQAEAALRREGGGRAVHLTVVIGALSGVDPEAFAFAYPLAAEGTLLEGAELRMEEIPARVNCRACGAPSEPDPLLIRCGACGSDEVDLVSGREFLLRELEMEDAPSPGPGANSGRAG